MPRARPSLAGSLLAMAVGLSACGATGAGSCARIDDVADPRSRAGMVRVPGGETVIGSDRFGPEERPVRRARVGSFWIDRREVTNREFSAFVEATGYRTVAERGGGGAVFREPDRIDGGDLRQWWRFDASADWRRPHGADGGPAHPDEPVVQVALADAQAYARWRGRDLPTEEEWERAARGGLERADYGWGDEPRPKTPAANTWQGVFPIRNTGGDGYKGVAPVGCFAPNGYGLHDMAGNVWELTRSTWTGTEPSKSPVIKGGSWLCSDDYCLRYRPAARQAADPTMGTDHIGFRTVWRERLR